MLRAQLQRHRGTETAQSQPPTSQPRRHKDTKESQSNSITGEVPAAGRPGTAGSGCSLGRKRPDQHPLPEARALGERRPRLSNLFWLGWVSNAGARAGTTTAGPTRPARRPGRRSSGTNACVRSRRASPREAAITIAGVAAAPLRATSSPQVPLLCVFFSVSPSVSLCLRGFSDNTGQHSEFRIHFAPFPHFPLSPFPSAPRVRIPSCFRPIARP